MRACICVFLLCCGAPAWSAELTYALQSPLVGGYNSSLISVETTHMNAVNQLAAKQDAAAKAAANAATQAANSSPSARFATSLQSQLFSTVSAQLSKKIAGLQDGGSGTFQAGDVSVQYVKTDGVISVTIVTPNGATTIELPTGS